MAHIVTNRGLQQITATDFSAADLRAAVFTGTLPAASTQRDWNFLQNVIDDATLGAEAAVAGYSRQDLANLTVTENDDPTNTVTITTNDATMTSVAAGETWTCIVYYIFNASDAAAPVISVDEPAATLVTNGGNVTIPGLNLTVAQA